MNEPAVTVLLCVRNGAATLGRQVRALDDQHLDRPWEIVVVDNGSTDGTRAIVDAWAARNGRVHGVDEPRAGANRARNRGVAAARAPLLVCCDADDEVAPGWLMAMTRALLRDDLVGARLDPGPLNGPFAPRAAVLQRRELPTCFGVPWSVGAALGFRRQVFDAVGGFDEAFVLGSDETDFCIRAQRAGFSIGFVPEAVVRYRVKSTAREVVRQRLHYGRGHERLVRKHAALGTIHSSPWLRWKTVAVGGAGLVRRSPDLVWRRTRLQYIAACGYLAGRVMELATTRPYSWRLDRSTWGGWSAR